LELKPVGKSGRTLRSPSRRGKEKGMDYPDQIQQREEINAKESVEDTARKKGSR